MRILVVIPHYFGPSHPGNNLPAIGSYIEPLGRVAAFNELIVSLHRHFGPNRHTFAGSPLPADAAGPPRHVDIVVIAMREHNLLSELGLTRGSFEVEFVDGPPPWLAFHAHRLLRDRLGAYDFYCVMEDDLSIHDPAFFEKVTWFQQAFGRGALLAPVRFEMSWVGTPAKVVIDMDLPFRSISSFRREGQREEIEGIWNGQRQIFRLPTNPHAASFFVTGEQLAYWVKQPTFDDRDASWSGPIESATTLSIGKVFDIYKPVAPDPFFLEVQHWGTRYASQNPPDGRRYGEPPLLAIAQNALRAAVSAGGDALDAVSAGDPESSFSRLVKLWLAQGTAVEQRARVDGLEAELRLVRRRNECLTTETQQLRAVVERLRNQLVRDGLAPPADVKG